MVDVVLVTGATGFLGTEISLRLLRKGCFIAALVRASNVADAELRLRRAWWSFPELSAALGKEIKAVPGDVSKEGLGLSQGDREWLVRKATYVLHCAADLRLHAPLEELDATNVKGTAKLLDLAEEAHHDHGIHMFGHVSTAYVSSGLKGLVPESEADEAGPQNNYERSKLRGEKEVRSRMSRMPCAILRPGMVVGDSRTGRVRTFNTIYYPLRLYLEGRLRLFPISSELRIGMVPVDHVAECAATLLLMPEANGLTFHLTPPEDRSPTIKELLLFCRDWARMELGVSLPRPIFVPMPEGLRGRLVAASSKGESSSLPQLSSYLQGGLSFSRANVDRFLCAYGLEWRAYLPSLLRHATYAGFMHETGRTVHEQLLFRLGQERRRARCHDIVDGAIVDVDSRVLRRDMLRAASALSRLGVSKGDRVAIVGLNSTRYLVLDVAIGLIGAVSVPLYYTSPPAELGQLCRDSGSKALLIGTRAIIERAEEIGFEGKVVSFCRPGPLPPSIMAWDSFLASGDPQEIGMAPVSPDDLATLRFTSSTTGKAKAARFSHRHLLYMAESMASLPPWRSRHAPVRYLSYLPMNHVVEGILATYAPYYAPTSVDLYFLEEFKGLREALPKVRPSIFFSVPRFYEKLWDNINSSGLGKSAMRGKALGRLHRPLVRRSALKRSGLDACDHLIVGSGPMSDLMLQDFRRLGIEVHNAYGLTEAPLVTLNRKGRNRIGSVGEPLPFTQVSVADDGEVLVKGPQVTSGYEGGAPSPIQDGWLRTGDLGSLEGGYLSLSGRKKELIKTSYGKFVSPMKVESLLRDSPLVAEALLVGEGRPYCVALLWPEGKVASDKDLADLDEMVSKVNSNLSQPERARRWAVVRGELSVDKGEVTANLKLRRSRVEAKYESLLTALYSDGTSHPDALHIGGER
ncbi:MAG TPA: AMP-binding protein [Methanomassiliicoccales archaeon]|nr:AMP-binding protein [Methanomassiliicoccales archaeon]